MLLKITTLLGSLFLWFKHCSSSRVLEASSQDAIFINRYCPKMEYCIEGSHVMCMYYDQKKIMGPKCNHPKNISMIPELAVKMLDIANSIRSRVALGKEKGKDGQPLPRGYGMFKLHWDSELATFAQVMANQCQLKHDMCRATKKFSEPGQTAGLVRFSYPDWYPVSRSNPFTASGLTVNKLIYAVQQILKSWYGQKEQVTPEMVNSYPDYAQQPDQQGGRLYLEMIYGAATHMGCGVSAYTEYSYSDKKVDMNFNSVEIICNFSARPRKQTAVYKVSPPTAVGYTVRCGCPVGTDEDAECLCSDSPRISNTPAPKLQCKKGDKNCRPAVVLLPIFTVEDAPVHKMMSRRGGDNIATVDEDSAYGEIFNDDHTLAEDAVIHDHTTLTERSIHSVKSKNRSVSKHTRRYDIPKVRKRYFRNLDDTIRNVKNGHNCNKKPKLWYRKSIFTQTAPFSLPHGEKYLVNDKARHGDSKQLTLKKDVVPRRFFTQINKENISKSDSTFGVYNSKHTTIDPTTEKEIISSDVINSLNEETDKKLMQLLDNLEQEVKHINLKGTNKEIFDSKIRKIYNNAVGKSDKSNNHLNQKIEFIMKKNNIPLEKPDTEKEEYQVNNNKEKIDDKNVASFNKRIAEEWKKSDLNPDNYKFQKETLDNDLNYNNYAKEIKDIDAENRNLYAGLKSNSEHELINPYKGKYDNSYRKTNMDVLKYYGVNDIIDEDKDKRYKNYFEDDISIERRKYYQEKLNNLGRKVHNVKSYRRREDKPATQHIHRPIRTNVQQDLQVRPTSSKSKGIENPLYMPERARYLQGY